MSPHPIAAWRTDAERLSHHQGHPIRVATTRLSANDRKAGDRQEAYASFLSPRQIPGG